MTRFTAREHILCALVEFVRDTFTLGVFKADQKQNVASFFSSVRSSSVDHGLLHIYKPSFSNFLNSSDSKVKVKGPNIFKSMGFKDIKYDIPVYQM